MKLNVLDKPDASLPWYGGGLKFTCSQCGNCCTGGPGFVWITKEEIARLAEYLQLTPQQVLKQYCRDVAGRISLKESRNPSHGGYDCIFLKEQPAPAGDGQTVTHTRRGCSIYPVRPLQCRTWPFWSGNLSSPAAWARASEKCPGMNNGEHFNQSRIDALKDAKDWPQKPPTSKGSPANK